MSDSEISSLSPSSPTPEFPDPVPPGAKKHRRKTVVMSMHEKLKALQKMKEGCPRHIIAKELGVHSRTVGGWLKNEKALQKWVSEHNGVIPMAIKRLKKPVHELIDRAMWMWHRERSAAGCTFTGPSIQVQALYFRNQLEIAQTFTASQGWLTKWQRRYGVKFATQSPTTAADQLLEDEETVAKYRLKIDEIIETEELTSDQVFFGDIIGLNYRQLPELVMNVECAPKGQPLKQLKERITLMACSNASGSYKIPLVVVGKFPNPMAIKDRSQLPVCYRRQRSSYITGRIFKDWFNNEFCPAVKEFFLSRGVPPKAVLFMDNCLPLPQEIKSQDIRVEFLPTNTVRLQSFDLGWVGNLKVLYRQQLIKFLMNNLSDGISLDEAMKNLTIREVMFWVANSWSKLSNELIVESWKLQWSQISENNSLKNTVKIEENSSKIETTNEEFDSGDSSPGSGCQNELALVRDFCEALNKTNKYNCISVIDIENWLHPGTKLTEDEALNEDEIVQIIKEENEINQLIKNLPPSPEVPKPSLTEAEAAINKVIEYCSSNPHYSREQRLALIAIRDIMKTEKKILPAITALAPTVTVPVYEPHSFDFVVVPEVEACNFNM